MLDSLTRRRLLQGGIASLAAMGVGRELSAEDPPVVPNASDAIRAMAENAQLKMRFNGQTAAECREWQSVFSSKLRGLLGAHLPPQTWKTIAENVVELDDHVMQERIRGRYSCGAQVIPGLLEYGDVPEIGSLIAPRHAVWETGSSDRLIVADWADDAMDRMRRVYRALGADQHLHRDSFSGGHRFSGRLSYPLLDKVLNS